MSFFRFFFLLVSFSSLVRVVHGARLVLGAGVCETTCCVTAVEAGPDCMSPGKGRRRSVQDTAPETCGLLFSRDTRSVSGPHAACVQRRILVFFFFFPSPPWPSSMRKHRLRHTFGWKGELDLVLLPMWRAPARVETAAHSNVRKCGFAFTQHAVPILHRLRNSEQVGDR